MNTKNGFFPWAQLHKMRRLDGTVQRVSGQVKEFAAMCNANGPPPRLKAASLAMLFLLAARSGVGQESEQALPAESADLVAPAIIALADEVPNEAVANEKKQDPAIARLQAQIDKLTKAEMDRKDQDAALPTTKIALQLQPDFYFFNQDDLNKATVGDMENGVAFRRARIGIHGDYGPTNYRIEFDWALSGRPSFLDVWAGLKDVAGIDQIRVGHFFEPFSLERYTPNRFMWFLERSLIDQAFAPARNTGIMANDEMPDEMGTWAIGVFRTNSDGFGDDVGDGGEYAVTGRVTRLMWYDDSCNDLHLLHVGAGYSYRDADEVQSRFQAQPEARVGAVTTDNVPFFVDTGDIPTDYFQLGGLEVAWVNGPLSMQTEYVIAPVHTLAGDDLLLQGWYAQASYFLTGEHRPYNKSKGVFDRVMPKHDLVPCGDSSRPTDGCGALEVAARLSHLDLNDEGIEGGRLTDFTVGTNWYLNPFMHVSFNYVRAFLDDPATGDSNADIFGSRVTYEF
jgi:phosphate-selective porin OprO and OprP